jgi:hypothetical protein
MEDRVRKTDDGGQSTDEREKAAEGRQERGERRDLTLFLKLYKLSEDTFAIPTQYNILVYRFGHFGPYLVSKVTWDTGEYFF